MSDVLFSDIGSLLDADMNDLEELPPIGIPPSGVYTLNATFGIKEVKDKQLPALDLEVVEVNELKDEEERKEVRVGQKFTFFFHLVKKDGTKNTIGEGQLREICAAFSERAGQTKIGAIMNEVKGWPITAEIRRKIDPKTDMVNGSLKNIIVL